MAANLCEAAAPAPVPLATAFNPLTEPEHLASPGNVAGRTFGPQEVAAGHGAQRCTRPAVCHRPPVGLPMVHVLFPGARRLCTRAALTCRGRGDLRRRRSMRASAPAATLGTKCGERCKLRVGQLRPKDPARRQQAQQLQQEQLHAEIGLWSVEPRVVDPHVLEVNQVDGRNDKRARALTA